MVFITDIDKLKNGSSSIIWYLWNILTGNKWKQYHLFTGIKWKCFQIMVLYGRYLQGIFGSITIYLQELEYIGRGYFTILAENGSVQNR